MSTTGLQAFFLRSVHDPTVGTSIRIGNALRGRQRAGFQLASAVRAPDKVSTPRSARTCTATRVVSRGVRGWPERVVDKVTPLCVLVAAAGAPGSREEHEAAHA